MTKTTLTERYIDAAMRSVPERQRPDLAQELRGSIDDQIEARIESGEEPEAAERAVLTELGDPDKLAAGYTDRPLYLIGPKYFLTWWRLLKLLLWIVPASVAFAVALGQALAGEPGGSIVGTTIGITLTVAVQLCFWVTLVFAFMEYWEARTGTKTEIGEWTVDNLPEPRVNGVGFGEMVGSIIWLIIAAGAVLWDHFLGFVPGMHLPFLNPELWPWWIAGLFVIMLAEAAVSVLVYLAGRWTYPLAVVNTVLNLAIAVPALWLLASGELVNPEFWSTILPDNAAEVPGILSIIVGFVIVGATVWSIIEAFLKARRASER